MGFRAAPGAPLPRIASIAEEQILRTAAAPTLRMAFLVAAAGLGAYLCLLAVLLAAALWKDSRLASPDAPAESAFVYGSVEYLVEYGPLADAGLASSPSFTAAFEPGNGSLSVRPMSLFADGAMWIRFDPPKVAGPDGRRIVSLPDPRYREARMVLLREGRVVRTAHVAIGDAVRRAGLSPRLPAFAFDEKELEGATLLLGWKTLSLLRAGAHVESERAFMMRVERHAVFTSLLCGGIFSVALAMFAFAGLMRNGDFALLGILAMTTVLTLFGGAGLVHAHLLPAFPDTADFVAFITKPLGVSLWMLLATRYGDMQRTMPAVTAAIRILALVIAFQSVFVGLKLWLGVPVPFVATSAAPVMAGLLFTAACLGLRVLAGDRRATLFALCWLPLVLGMLARSLMILAPGPATSDILARDLFVDVAASILLLAVASVAALQRSIEHARKAAETAEDRSRRFAEIASQGFVVIAPDGAIARADGPLCRLLGLVPGVDAGRRLLARVLDEDRPALAGALGAAGEEPRLAEIGFATPEGRPVWLALALQRDEATGETYATLGDVTAKVLRRRGEARAGTLLALGKLAASVAHEVNNLIHPVINLTRRLQQRHLADPEGRRLAELVLQSGERAGVIVASLLDGMRSAGKPASKSPLHAAVSAAVDMLEASAPRGVRFIREIDTSCPLLCDPGEVLQVVANLAANSIRAFGERGELAIRLGAEGSDWALRVEDDGPGVPPRLLGGERRLGFDDDADGSGIGLYVVETLAGRWGARLELALRPQGGSVACVTIPGNTAEGRQDG